MMPCWFTSKPSTLRARADTAGPGLGEDCLYLAVVIVLFSRQVVGWSLGERMTRQLAINALRMAWFRRQPPQEAGLIFHSDRGSQ